MVDEEILYLLGNGNVQDGEEQYWNLFRVFCRYFEWRNCEDPEGLAQTVFARGLERLQEGVELGESGLSGFLYGIARLLALEERKSRKMVPIAAAKPVEEISHSGDAEKSLLIKQYLKHLTSDEQRTLVDYVNGKRGGGGALRIKVFRIRQKLLTLQSGRKKS